jgi:O-antigen biosynthesis protein
MIDPDPDTEALTRTLASLRAQTSRRWFLTVVTRQEALPVLRTLVHARTRRRDRRRVKILAGTSDAHAVELLVLGIEQCRGSNVALLFPGDIWAPDAVAMLGNALTPLGAVYADEDRVTADAGLVNPRLKPDFSPDFLASSSYVGRPLAMGAQLAERLRGLEDTGVAELEHQCTVFACAAADSVTHIPEVLCHRSDNALAPFGFDTDRQMAVHPGEELPVSAGGSLAESFRIRRPDVAATTISIMIPFRDEPRLLRTCVESIWATTRGEDVELVLIDNGSTDPETATLVDHLASRPDVRVLSDPRPFNWAQLNNSGARIARGEVLVFLNNDIEARRMGWLGVLTAHALRTDVGAVGPRLLYPDGRLQHCGIVVGLGGAAGHPLLGLTHAKPGYLRMVVSTRECSAVTGACLATRREVFDAFGGFDESLGVDLNDVDFCLRLAGEGYRTIYEPSAELLHHESPSRGTAGGTDDTVNFVRRWKHYIDKGDPYFSAHLTRTDPSCGLVKPGEEDTWRQWYATLTRT